MAINLGKPRDMVKERPGVLQSVGLQRVGQDWEAEQQQMTKNVQDHFLWSQFLKKGNKNKLEIKNINLLINFQVKFNEIRIKLHTI